MTEGSADRQTLFGAMLLVYDNEVIRIYIIHNKEEGVCELAWDALTTWANKMESAYLIRVKVIFEIELNLMDGSKSNIENRLTGSLFQSLTK